MTKFKMYKSTGEDALFVSVSQDQLKSQDSGLETTTILLDDQQTYQEMDGFGASFSD